MAKINVTNQVVPDTPDTGTTDLYIDSADKKLKSIDDSGTVVDYSGGSAVDWEAPSQGTIHSSNYVDTDTIYTHPNHSGDVTSTGDGAQVIASSAITGKTLVDAAGGDSLLISDVSDGGNLKETTVERLHERPQTVTTWTPTITGGGSFATASTSGIWYRDGRFMKVRVNFEGSVAGSAASYIEIDLPGSYTIDTDYMLWTVGDLYENDCVGFGRFWDSGAGGRSVFVIYHSTTKLRLSDAFGGTALVAGNRVGANDLISINFEIPIAAWA